jgi:alginate O-acetyltransferase complex protein AlgI
LDFISLEYIPYLILLTILFYCIKSEFRTVFIILSNLIFYLFFGLYFTIIFYSVILITYLGGIVINTKDSKNRRSYLWLFIALIASFLLFFKFQNYILIDTKILFPVGLSFLTFKSISFLVEIYRRNNKFEVNFINSFLYLSFFPSIRSGPIDKPDLLISQFNNGVSLDINNILMGVKLIIWGVFKKIVIADRLAYFVSNIYDKPYDHRGFTLVIATILYSLQIYYDFSGYTDIALGSANLIGIKITNNFNRPYFSRSIPEFWRKWHITLSVWLRDYLFLPISYFLSSRFIKIKATEKKFEILSYSISILITMVIAGFWHGNGINFIIWGFLFALYLIISRSSKKFRGKTVKLLGLKKVPYIYHPLQIIFTFALVSFAWVFFRANNFQEAVYVIKNLFYGISDISFYLSGYSGIFSGLTEFDNSKIELLYCLFFIIAAEFFQTNISEKSFAGKYSVTYRWIIYYFVIFSILLFGVSHFQKFIYYNF